MTTAMMRYAMSVAHGALGDVDAAERQAARFDEAVEAVPDSRYVFNNRCIDILAIAREMMLGELAYRRGEHEAAFSHLRQSVELDDNLPYDEPWGWMQPTRHALAALLLEQDRVEEATAVYRADLGYDDTLSRACQHPDNVWSLHGYHECLERLGRHAEAAIVETEAPDRPGPNRRAGDRVLLLPAARSSPHHPATTDTRCSTPG